MNISYGLITIDALPNGATIDVHAGQSIGVEIPEKAYTAQEVEELRDALTLALKHFSSGAEPAEKRKPRVFTRNSAEPVDVVKVEDCDGEIWLKGPRCWGLANSSGRDGTEPWSHVLRYDPLTEVIES